MIVKCATCGSDPAARWRQPPKMIFIESLPEGAARYRCRDHVTPLKEEELQTREKALGWSLRTLR
jgi:hypothetical protein